MKKQLGITLALSIGLLSADLAIADDAVWGALLGGGAGAVVGRSFGGRDGAIVGGALGAAAGAAIGSERGRARIDYSPPQTYYAQPVHYPQQVYSPPPVSVYYAQPVYYARPLQVAPPPVYYIQGGYDRDERRHRHHRRHDHDRHDHDRGWGNRY